MLIRRLGVKGDAELADKLTPAALGGFDACGAQVLGGRGAGGGQAPTPQGPPSGDSAAFNG